MDQVQAQLATGDQPWLLHLGYYRPHPPFIAPAPYHEMYDPADVPAPVRVPRWQDDHNYMTVLAEIRTIPEHIETTYDRLLPHFQRLYRTHHSQ